MEENKITNERGEIIKLYSQKAIGLATFFGGPLAAGILIRQNFINLGKEEHGKQALFIGIVSTILLFAGLFAIPDSIIDKVPSSVVPAVYTGIILMIVELVQGHDLRVHTSGNGDFYSAWNAVGIGLVCLVILLAGIFGYAYFEDPGFEAEQYDKAMMEFQKNEEEALVLYELLEDGKETLAIDFIQETGIDLWNKNLAILYELDQLDGLTQEFIDQNQILREYCELRIESYQLIGRALYEKTSAYDKQLGELLRKIDDKVDEL